jgi:GxxExxY protein
MRQTLCGSARGNMIENQITSQIINAAIGVHTELGPGLLESVYEVALKFELEARGLKAICQQPIPIIYKTVRLETGFRADLVVDDRVIVELKSIESIAPVHLKQLLTYLKLADKRVGLLLNFGTYRMKDGIKRVVNGFEE